MTLASCISFTRARDATALAFVCFFPRLRVDKLRRAHSSLSSSSLLLRRLKPELIFTDFDEYHIIRRASEGQGKYKYSAFHSKDEVPVELHITGASESRDPLKEIQVINLRVDGEKFITGMDDNGDCVVRK